MQFSYMNSPKNDCCCSSGFVSIVPQRGFSSIAPELESTLFDRNGTDSMDYLPVTLQLEDRHCLIVGGGSVAARKLRHLRRAGAKVTLVSLAFGGEVQRLASEHNLTLIKGEFEIEHLEGVYLVIAATNDETANQFVSRAAQEHSVWVNVVDNLELSTLIMPAVVDRSPLLIAISTGGVSPVLARKIREKLEWLLPTKLGELLTRLKILRPQLKKKFSEFGQRREFTEWLIESAIANPDVLEQSDSQWLSDYEQGGSELGKVWLVGAGPGSADLLTVKALKLLQKADVVLHDSLVSDEVLEQVRRDARLIPVGKRANRPSVKQETINSLLIEHARKGQRVVRLKGGDPFIFGRGGEELQALRAANIDFEAVPGITAAAGCAAYAGIPLTHRDHSQSLTFLTAHGKASVDRLNWRSLAREQQTLVVYMGLMRNQILANNLIRHGRAPSTPCAIIENGARPEQRVVLGSLAQLPEMVEQRQLKSPALIVIGEVARLAEELSWYQRNNFTKFLQGIENNADGAEFDVQIAV